MVTSTISQTQHHRVSLNSQFCPTFGTLTADACPSMLTNPPPPPPPFNSPCAVSAPVHSNILLIISLSSVNNFRFIHSCSTHVSLAHVITGLIIHQRYFNLVFFDTNLLLNTFWLAQYVLLPRATLSLISSSTELSPFRIDPKYLQDFACSKYLQSILYHSDHFLSLNILNIPVLPHLQIIQNVLNDLPTSEKYELVAVLLLLLSVYHQNRQNTVLKCRYIAS